MTVATDPQVGKTESGHLQAYIYIGDVMYNNQLLQISYARVTESKFSKRPLFVQRMQMAQ